jgi:hypothetical protein
MVADEYATDGQPFTEQLRGFQKLYTCVPALRSGLPDPPRSTAFDYAKARPHLAFFCRLELNIEAATSFPVRFRLGEVRSWQQSLSKRE